MNTPRHDYRDPVTGKFAKRVVSYPQADLAYPTIVETGDRKKSAAPLAFGQAHPEYSGALLVAQDVSTSDNNSTNQQLTYETIPGPLMKVSEAPDSDGILLTTTRQKKLTSAIVEGDFFGEGDTVWRKISSEAIDGLYSWEVVTSRAVPGNRITTTVLLEDGQPGTRIEQILGIHGNTVETGATIESSTLDPLGEWVAKKTTVTTPSVFDALSKSSEQVAQVGDIFLKAENVSTTVEQIIEGASLPTPSLGSGGTGVLSVSGQRITVHKYRTTSKSLSGTPLSSRSFRQLSEQAMVLEKIIEEGSSASLADPMSGTDIIESNPMPLAGERWRRESLRLLNVAAPETQDAYNFTFQKTYEGSDILQLSRKYVYLSTTYDSSMAGNLGRDTDPLLTGGILVRETSDSRNGFIFVEKLFSRLPEAYDNDESTQFTFPGRLTSVINPYGVRALSGRIMPQSLKPVARVHYEFANREDLAMRAISPLNFFVPEPFSTNACVIQQVPVAGVSGTTYLYFPLRLNRINFCLHDGYNAFFTETTSLSGSGGDTVTFSVAIPPSAPTAAQYETWITKGTEFVVESTVKQWLGPIDVRITKYVRAQ